MQAKHNMKKRKNILLLSILLNLIYCEVSGQTYNSFKNEVVLKIEELLDSKLVNSESDTKAYDFKIDTSEIKIRGVRQILEFDYRYKKKKIFKSINRKNIFNEMEMYLSELKFQKVYQDENFTMATYRRGNDIQTQDYLEFYFPNSFDYLIEVIYVLPELKNTERNSIAEEIPIIEFYNPESDKTINFDCKVKTSLPINYHAKELSVFEYTGKNFDQPGIALIKFPVSERSTKWENKIVDKDCKSADPNDCKAWCLVEIPPSYDSIAIVIDTSIISEYEIKDIQPKYFDRKISKYASIIQIICEEDLDVFTIHKIQKVLILKGYYKGELTRTLTTKTKTAIMNFQKEVDLPLGQLDFETLLRLFTIDNI